MERKKNIDILIIRPLLILSICVGHAFAIFSGDWELPACSFMVSEYKWINPFFISFQLQCFVFVSGFLYGAKSNNLSNPSFLKKKALRLLVPAFFWGILYLFIFYSDYKDVNVLSMFFQILGGLGHLWFLPMLYGCFVVVFLLDLRKVRLMYYVLGSLILCVFSIPMYYIGVVFHYCFFFIWGIVFYKYQSVFFQKINIRTAGLFLLLFLFSFIIYYKGEEVSFFVREKELWNKIGYYLVKNSLELIMSMLGILSLFSMTVLCSRKILHIPAFLLLINIYCYPVFIYHQFILRYYFFKTDIFCVLPSYIVPWIGLLLSLVVSIILAHLCIKFRLGRFLLGC